MIPKNRKPTHPGEILLKEFLEPMGMSQVELAARAGVSRQLIGAAEAGRHLPRVDAALASGAAGVLAFTTGVSATLIGVMVAVALLPPLTVSGLLLGAGHVHDSFFAFLLLMTNIICINLSGIITFWFRGISPRTWWEADKAKKSTRKALVSWTVTLGLLIAVILLWQTD